MVQLVKVASATPLLLRCEKYVVDTQTLFFFNLLSGGFTQVVWKSSTQVACAQAECAAGTIYNQKSTITVCRYSPPGNMQGQFSQNVGRRVA